MQCQHLWWIKSYEQPLCEDDELWRFTGIAAHVESIELLRATPANAAYQHESEAPSLNQRRSVLPGQIGLYKLLCEPSILILDAR